MRCTVDAGRIAAPGTLLIVGGVALRLRGREELALRACHRRCVASHRYLVYARPIDR